MRTTQKCTHSTSSCFTSFQFLLECSKFHGICEVWRKTVLVSQLVLFYCLEYCSLQLLIACCSKLRKEDLKEWLVVFYSPLGFILLDMKNITTKPQRNRNKSSKKKKWILRTTKFKWQNLTQHLIQMIQIVSLQWNRLIKNSEV